MGHLASTPSGVARFALHTGSPVLMGLVVRQPGGRHRLVIDPPLEIPDTGDAEKDLYGILLKYNEYLERHLRAFPHQWFWPHRRWKTRPPSEKPSASFPGDHRDRR
jgi:KDO2-lipid IV(A) lauroyltransferase